METNKNKKKNAKAPNAKKGGMKTVAMDRYLVPSTVSLSSAKKSSTAESSDAATAKKACRPVVLPAVVTERKERVPLAEVDNIVGFSAVGSPAAAAKRATSTECLGTGKENVEVDVTVEDEVDVTDAEISNRTERVFSGGLFPEDEFSSVRVLCDYVSNVQEKDIDITTRGIKKQK